MSINIFHYSCFDPRRSEPQQHGQRPGKGENSTLPEELARFASSWPFPREGSS